MHIREIFDSQQTTCSFEFFPPKTEKGAARLFKTIQKLEELRPAFVSVTYGAGGSTRQLTHELVVKIKTETSLESIPHLTCVCHQADEIDEITDRYRDAGIENLLALGGDPPQSKDGWDRSQDAFRYAEGLVAHLRGRYGDKVGIGVAGFPEGHPGTPNRLAEMEHLKAKVDAGADYICTQLFFDNRDLYDFRDRCALAGIDVPVVAGIMPVTSTKGMKRMAELAGGARYPATLLRALDRAGDDEAAVERVGIHHATEQCRDLIDNGVSGLHFYTLNQSDATQRIYENLGIRDSRALG